MLAERLKLTIRVICCLPLWLAFAVVQIPTAILVVLWTPLALCVAGVEWSMGRKTDIWEVLWDALTSPTQMIVAIWKDGI